MEELIRNIVMQAVEDALVKYKPEYDLDEVLSIEDLMEYLKVSRVTLMKLITEDGIPFFKIGNQYRFNREDIRSWRLNQSMTNTEKTLISNRSPYKIKR